MSRRWPLVPRRSDHPLLERCRCGHARLAHDEGGCRGSFVAQVLERRTDTCDCRQFTPAPESHGKRFMSWIGKLRPGSNR